MTTSDLLDWDPLPQDREYYRNGKQGDRGYLVRRKGQDVIRLDRPMQEIIFPKTPDWMRDEYGSLLLESQVSAIAFAADRAVCASLGLWAESRKSWQDLTDRERTNFSANGPPLSSSLRTAVYEGIREALRGYTREG